MKRPLEIIIIPFIGYVSANVVQFEKLDSRGLKVVKVNLVDAIKKIFGLKILAVRSLED